MASENEVRQFASLLTSAHGDLQEARCLVQQKIELVFADGHVETVGGRQGLCCGYYGTGTRFFHLFLTECGFNVTMEDVQNVSPNPDDPPIIRKSGIESE